MASSSVLSTSRIDSETTVVVSNAISYSSPGGKRFDSRSSSARDVLVHVERVGGRQLHDAEADRLAAR